MVATNNTGTLTSKAQLLEIIQTGRSFLLTLEQFAVSAFPDEDYDATIAVQEHDDDIEGDNPTNDDVFCVGGVRRSKRIRSGVSLPSTTNTEDNLQPAKRLRTSPPIETATPTHAHDAREPRQNWRLPSSTTADVTRNTDSPQATTTRKPSVGKGAVIKLCAKTGLEVARYKTASDAAQALCEANPISTATRAKVGISYILRKKREVIDGHTYRYVNDTSPLPTFPLKTGTKIFKPLKRVSVNKFHPNGTFVSNFVSAADAARDLIKEYPSIELKRLEEGLRVYLRKANAAGMNELGVVETYKGYVYHKSITDEGSADTSIQIPATALIREFVPRKPPKVKTTNGASENNTSDIEAPTRNVIQLSAETGLQVAVYKNAAEAAEAVCKANPMSTVSRAEDAISNILRKGNRREIDGHIYRYRDDTSPLPTFPIAKKSTMYKTAKGLPLKQFQPDGTYIATFVSASHASCELSREYPTLRLRKLEKGMREYLHRTKGHGVSNDQRLEKYKGYIYRYDDQESDTTEGNTTEKASGTVGMV